jgi:hypothetical protein
MIATMLVALFATVALTSAATLADAVVRGRNAFRLLRADMARMESERLVTVYFESLSVSAPMPALRAAAVNQRLVRRPARQPERLRAAA